MKTILVCGKQYIRFLAEGGGEDKKVQNGIFKKVSGVLFYRHIDIHTHSDRNSL